MSLITTRKKFIAVPDDAIRNGQLPAAASVSAIAKAANFIMARHNRVLINQWIGADSPTVTTNPCFVWRYNQLHQHGRQLKHEVVCLRVLSDPAPANRYFGNTTAGPALFSVLDSDALLAPEATNKAHTVLTENVVPSLLRANRQNGVGDGFRLVAACVQERPSPSRSLDTANGPTAVPAEFVSGEMIVDAAIEQRLRAAVFHAWNYNRRQLIAYSAIGTATTAVGIVTRSSLAYANMLDQSITVWTASTPGFVLPLENCAAGTATTLPIRGAVYAQCVDTATGGAPAGTGEVRFTNGTTTVDVTGIAGATGWFEMASTFAAKANVAYDKIDVLLHTTNAADTVRVWAVSAWEEPT